MTDIQISNMSNEDSSSDSNAKVLVPDAHAVEVIDDEENRLSTKKTEMLVIVFALIVLTTGTYNTVSSKALNLSRLKWGPGQIVDFYAAPWWSTFSMYIGEFMCLGASFIDVGVAKRKVHKLGRGYKRGDALSELASSPMSFQKQELPFYFWALPTCCDYFATVCINYAFLLTYASTVQMLRNMNVVFTAIITLFIVKKALIVHQWVGVAILTVALCITGVAGMMNPDDSTDNANAALGVPFAIIGTLITSFQFAIEEKMFRKYYSGPLFGVGCQGVFGSSLGGLVLIIAEFTGLEHTSDTLYMVANSSKALWLTIGFILSVSFFNGCGLGLSKLGSAVLRIVVITGRTATIWIVELCLGWNEFKWYDFISQILLVIGIMAYQDYIPFIKRGKIWYRPIMFGGCCKRIGLMTPDEYNVTVRGFTTEGTAHHDSSDEHAPIDV